MNSDHQKIALRHAFVWIGRSDTYIDTLTFRNAIRLLAMAISGASPECNIYMMGIPPIPEADRFTTSSLMQLNSTIRTTCRELKRLHSYKIQYIPVQKLFLQTPDTDQFLTCDPAGIPDIRSTFMIRKSMLQTVGIIRYSNTASYD